MNKKTKRIVLYFGIATVFLIIAGNYMPISFAFLIALAGFVWVCLRKPKETTSEDMPNLTKSKEEYYKEMGLSSQEIDFFRSTMNTAKKQINQLQTNVAQSTKLKAIDLRNDTLKIAKSMFKELVKEPQKLHQANHFLYTHLPNLVELTNKHLEIEQHTVKTKQVYEKLEESAQIIDQLSKLIGKDYEEFVADDLEDLDVEITIAKNSINRDNKDK
jgi:5-bromo-4-chloroindolyl phosphate hydrolysis protein